METKVFFHFIEEAVFNSFILYKKRGSKKRFLQFKLNLIYSFLRQAHILMLSLQKLITINMLVVNVLDWSLEQKTKISHKKEV